MERWSCWGVDRWLVEARNILAAEGGGEGVDDHDVIDALMQAAGDDRADETGAGERDGEASAMHGVVGEGKAVALFDGFALLLELQADGVGAAAEAHDNVAFAADPIGLAGGGEASGREEDGTSGDLDLEGHGGLAGDCVGAQPAAEVPGGIRAEGGELEQALLGGDGVEIGCDAHRKASVCAIIAVHVFPSTCGQRFDWH